MTEKHWTIIYSGMLFSLWTMITTPLFLSELPNIVQDQNAAVKQKIAVIISRYKWPEVWSFNYISGVRLPPRRTWPSTPPVRSRHASVPPHPPPPSPSGQGSNNLSYSHEHWHRLLFVFFLSDRMPVCLPLSLGLSPFASKPQLSKEASSHVHK